MPPVSGAPPVSDVVGNQAPGPAQAGPDFSAKPTLRGERVVLRPLRAEDSVPMARIFQDAEVAELTGSVHRSGEPVPVMDPQRLREIYAGWAAATDRMVFAILDPDTGQVVGESVLNDLDPGNRSCGFRILIGPEGRGRGLGTEATRLTVEHALHTVGLHRVTLEVYAFNPRARHVYASVGFRQEGTGRDALAFDGSRVDVEYMAALATDPEWERIRPIHAPDGAGSS